MRMCMCIIKFADFSPPFSVKRVSIVCTFRLFILGFIRKCVALFWFWYVIKSTKHMNLGYVLKICEVCACCVHVVQVKPERYITNERIRKCLEFPMQSHLCDSFAKQPHPLQNEVNKLKTKRNLSRFVLSINATF